MSKKEKKIQLYIVAFLIELAVNYDGKARRVKTSIKSIRVNYSLKQALRNLRLKAGFKSCRIFLPS